MNKLILFLFVLFVAGCSSSKNKSTEVNNQIVVEEGAATVAKTSLTDLEDQCRDQETTSAIKSLGTQYVNYKNDSNYWNLIGACFLNDEKPLKARLFFLRALEEDKKNAAALNNLGMVYWKMSKHYEALAYFKRAESSDGSAVAVKYNLARLYSWYGLHKISNQKFYETPPSNLNSQDYNDIGINQTMLGQNENAVKSFRATKQNDHKVQAVFAVALKRSGQDEEAQITWKQAKVAATDSITWLWLIGE